MNSSCLNQLLQHLQTVVKRPYLQQSYRTSTYIVERKYPTPLTKVHKFPSLRRRHQVFDVVQKKVPSPFVPSMMNILLTEYVENVGTPGERVDIKAKTGRELILKNKAVYPTQENLEKYGRSGTLVALNYSSRYVKNTMDILSKFVLSITMNKENPWTLEPWHVSVAFRKAHVIVPDYAITMPATPIKGPDMSLESKEFYVTVTINKTEQVIVRCRIHHWATKLEERLPWVPFHFKKPALPIFEEDKVVAAQLPEIGPVKMDEEELSDFISKMKLKSHVKAKL